MHFLASQKRRILVGLILCIYLNFIVIVLQPFDTSQFEADYKTLLLSGYGILTCFVFVIHGSIENIWYSRFGKIWLVWYEIMTTITFCFLAGTVLYLYNVYIVNEGKSLSTGGYLNFLFITTAGMVPVFVPPMLYLRQKFGERIMPLSDNSITLIGENKNEILKLEKETLLFIKAVENYIEICFIDKTQKVTSKTFRQTLSNVCEQLPFLQKCHRSYLVNTGTIKEIIGNSQGAKITFSVGDKEIPLSKTYYKDIKNSLL
ncbi:LytTR family DNA-binding domain-containing protein [Flavobacterium sp.]|uniref:LytR/AlgR family response regulator transcription factor n=1 Tax=Flavobacterium sp. TaxID=239 RepID=UPI0026043BD4|nr:LytTR family DNA-binding domain-containing protein [Flavobacterium sp.]